MRRLLVIPALALLGLLHSPLSSQTVTGTITGTVLDPSGAAVANAEVVLTQSSTGASRKTVTNEQGDFVVGSLQPGTYDITVTAPGFKTLQKTGFVLTSAETLAVGRLSLTLGSTTEQITVEASGLQVQLNSSDRSGVISAGQLENLLTKGRNPMSLIALLPGVVDRASPERIDRNFNISVQGNRRNANIVTVDGMPTNPIGNNFNSTIMLSQDAIEEVKVLLTNYPAEYGRSTGATINFITKSGTKEFHGLVSYFKRHEQFNANDFFNNRFERPRPRYRYNTWNYNIGGPVVFPKFNRNRDKLFFFWSQEFWPLRTPTAIAQLTVPTLLERRGDFSQSLDLNNRLIPIRDPLANAPFPNNIIPASRLSSNGLALLRRFPEPNFLDRSISGGRYNYVFQAETETPIRMENARIDYRLSANHSFAFTYASYLDRQKGAIGILTSGATNWPQKEKTYQLQGIGYILRYTGILSPTLINELSVGATRRPEGNRASEEAIRANQAATIGFRAGQLFPQNNPLGLMPNANFAGVPNAANLFMEGRFPFYQRLYAFNITNNVTKTYGSHTFKVGILVERCYTGALADGNYYGTYNFGADINNPLNTNYAYAGAALGAFNSYSEASSRIFNSHRQPTVEWFGQDLWRVNRRLTLEYGVRFHYFVPNYMRTNALAAFNPDRYDPAQRVFLVQPVRNAANQRVGRNPNTGELLPAALIGAIAPGRGNPTNGMTLAGRDGIPRGFVPGYDVKIGPRFGFAYDIFGNGKTALRGGFGRYFSRPNTADNLNRFTGQPPLITTPTIFYGTIETLRESTGFVFPQNVNGYDTSDRLATVMNFSMSIQQDIGYGTIVDVGYVGSLGRNLMWLRNLNPVPLGANFRPENADPTNPSTPLPAPFLRPIPGYNDIFMTEAASSSNYHSLQVTARRRFIRGIQYGLAWTWSKALNYGDVDNAPVSVLASPRFWNYGLSDFDRTHTVRIDWTYNFPTVKTNVKPVDYVLNHWQLSGITSFVSGEPLNVTWSNVTPIDITGTPSQGARIDVTGNPNLPRSQRTFSRNFRTEVFRRPAVGTFGNSARTQIRGPGINNWDMVLMKDFPIRESWRLQFRAEAYNAFNHTQFATLDTAARFDAAGNQVNTRLGEFLSARAPRVMQFALRMYF
ncbi:MAG: carboxypeptidase regulatory-like domain-containing protein [Bryobacteraceae bacterium]|nr:carboxypeptidase regulatory-like domain-containing protein [Bryobacteraceae bacterium]MDW8376858.1 carboxypeptidase regulatory-like domain-containing protein [Bryobacterales bacterium]